MGRRPLSATIPIEKMLKVYAEEGSEPRAAARLGITDRSLRKYLHRAGITPRKGRPPGRSKHGSKFARWLRDHPDEKLPRNVKEIASITNCSIDTIYAYIRRRKTLLKEHEATLPDLRDVSWTITLPSGALTTTNLIHSYSVQRDESRMALRVKALLTWGNEVEFLLEGDFLEKKLKDLGEK